MPGFNIAGGGGNGPSNQIEIRRVHRWTFQVLQPFSTQALLVLQKAGRPSFEFEDVMMHHNQEHAHFAGKQKWTPIELVFYDVEQSPDMSKEVYAWLGTVVDLGPVNVAHPSKYKTQALLQLEDGFGNADESWDIYGAWPLKCDWGSSDLDYTSTELLTIKATLSYDRAERRCGNTSTQGTTSMSC